jgi:hypothetical protein
VTDRDALAALIRPHLDGGTLPDHLVGGMAAAWQAEQIADDILADGWRRQRVDMSAELVKDFVEVEVAPGITVAVERRLLDHEL